MKWKPTAKRPVSWSCLSSFYWNADEWYEKYVVHGECQRAKDGIAAWCAIACGFNPLCPAVQTSPQMIFGSKIGKAYEADPVNFKPKLPVFQIYEHEYACNWKGIPLTGFADGWTPPELHLGELKTGVKPWTQKRADEHGQITMYNLMAFLIDGIKPEDIRNTLMWLPTRMTGDKVSLVPKTKPVLIETKRTTAQALQFGTAIVQTVEDMKAFAERHN